MDIGGQAIQGAHYGQNGQPSQYSEPHGLKLTLAASIALMVHAALAVSFLLFLPSEPEPQHRVRLQLSPHGQESSAASDPSVAASSASASEPQTQAEPKRDEMETAAPQAREQVTTSAPREQHAPQQESGKPEIAVGSPLSSVAEQGEPNRQNHRTETTPSEPSVAAEPSLNSTPAGASGPAAPRETAQRNERTADPEEEKIDPYQLALSRHMLKPIRQVLRRGPMLDRWNDAVADGTSRITIELRLLSNGALREVRLMESSGNDVVDRVAVQSALAASPYPPPPSEERQNGFRFTLDLIMAPVYL